MATNERLTDLPVEITGPGSGDQRLTDLPVEIVGPGSGDQRVSALPVEIVGPGSGDQRLSALTVEIVAPQTVPSALRVTQDGAQIAYAVDDQRVTQAGAQIAYAADALRVTQIGLIIVYGGTVEEPIPPPPTPSPEELCVLDIPSVERWSDGTPSVSCIGAMPTTPESASLWDPEFGATSAISSQYWADRYWAPRYWSNYWGASVTVQLPGECVIERPSVSLWNQ